MLPDFICIGASKSGTTTLYDILKQNKNIALSNIKETQFFVKKSLYEQGPDRYEGFFDSDNEIYQAVGEICPQYMSSTDVAKRIEETLGKDIKIIVMIRNPIDRALSHYHMKTRIIEDKPFHEAIKSALTVNDEDGERLREDLNFSNFELINDSIREMNLYRYSRYIYPGYYATILKEYIDLFGIGKIHVVIFEDFIKDIETEVKKILDFLEVNEDADVDYAIHSNKKIVYRSKVVKRLRNLTHLISIDRKLRIRQLIGSNIYDVVKGKVEFLASKKKVNTEVDEVTYKTLMDIYLPQLDIIEDLFDLNLQKWKI